LYCDAGAICAADDLRLINRVLAFSGMPVAHREPARPCPGRKRQIRRAGSVAKTLKDVMAAVARMPLRQIKADIQGRTESDDIIPTQADPSCLFP
jgi:hypothetical protein